MNFEQKVDYMADGWALTQEQQINARIVQAGKQTLTY